MKFSKKNIFIALSASIILAAIIHAAIRLEIASSQYKSYAEISSIPNIFEAGWIPEWLPKSAENIMESHDIDTNVSWVIFTFSDSDNFYSNCSQLMKNNAPVPDKSTAKRFPEFVSVAIDQIILNDKLSFFSCDFKKNRFLAVDREKHIGYVWTVAK
jgi:hypothetical protein